MPPTSLFHLAPDAVLLSPASAPSPAAIPELKSLLAPGYIDAFLLVETGAVLPVSIPLPLPPLLLPLTPPMAPMDLADGGAKKVPYTRGKLERLRSQNSEKNTTVGACPWRVSNSAQMHSTPSALSRSGIRNRLEVGDEDDAAVGPSEAAKEEAVVLVLLAVDETIFERGAQSLHRDKPLGKQICTSVRPRSPT